MFLRLCAGLSSVLPLDKCHSLLWPLTLLQVDFSPKDLAQVANFLAKENAAKQVGPRRSLPRTSSCTFPDAAKHMTRCHRSGTAASMHQLPNPHASPMQAPIQQYARSLMERARQRLQMRLADEIELGTARGGEDR